MRVCFDHQIFSLQEYGGISRYFQELAHHLAYRTTFDARIVCPLYINRHLKEDHGISITGFFLPKPPKLGRAIHKLNCILTPLILRSLRPDVVHETYYSPQPVAPRGSKMVLTVFDMIHERQSIHFSPSDPTTRAKRLAVERADHVICISESTRRDLVELFAVNPARVSVVYLGHSMNVKPALIGPRMIKEPYILHVGVRDGYKNFRRLLQAYGSNERLKKDFSLICLGAGPFSEEELALIRSLGISENKVLWRKGSDIDLTNLYSHAALFVYPSLYEGFGIPPLEAMALNCPVACGRTSSLPEVAGKAAEYFDPESVAEIAEAMIRVLYSPERASKLIEEGKKRLALFSWEKCAADTRRIYEAL